MDGFWGFIDMLIVAGYLVALLYIGLRGACKVGSSADFAASGHRYGTAVLFASLSSSYIGGGYSSGNAAESFSGGIAQPLALLGFSLATVLAGIFLTRNIDSFSGVTTAGGVIGRHYGRAAQIATGVFSFLCCAGVVGAQMETVGVVFHALFGVPRWAGILIACGVMLCYSTAGGLGSIVVADVLQFVLLAVGMPVLLGIALVKAGGIGAVLQALPPAYTDPFGEMSPPAFFSLFATMAFGEMLVPPYMQRLLIGKNVRSVRRATILSGLFSAPVFMITGAIGLTAYTLGVTQTPAEAMPALILAVMPPVLRGCLMAAQVSVIMSAADGFLNGAAVGVVNDSIALLRPGLSDRSRLHLMRAVNLGTGAVAVAVALMIPDVFGILTLAYECWCPVILVPLSATLLGLHPPKCSFFISGITGAITSLAWRFCGNPWGIGAAIVGLGAALTAFLVCAGVHFATKHIKSEANRGHIRQNA